MSDDSITISEAEILPEKVRLLYQSMNFSMIGVSTNVVILVIMLWSVIPLENLLAWSGLMLSTLVIRYISYYFYNQSDKTDNEFWYKIYYSGITTTALTWALGAYALFPELIVDQVPVIIVFAGVSAASVASLAFDKTTNNTYLTLMLVPLAIQYYLFDGSNSGTLGTLVLIYLAVLVSSVTRFHQQFLDNVLLAKKAQQASEAKSQFLSSMSHELRTPMNAILSFTRLMLIDKDKEQLTENHVKNINEVIRAGEHLMALINEVLDLSKIENNVFEVNLKNENLTSILNDCFELVEPLLKEQSITLSHNDLSGPEIIIKTDRVKLKQVLLNLLSNAIKYNREGGFIYVISEVQKSEIKISFEDTGTGIAAEEMKRLFIPFDRLGKESKGIEGAGIGLVITKKIIDNMGGEIGCESEVGRGTIFWLSLPYDHKAKFDQAVASNNTFSSSTENSPDTYVGTQFTLLYIEDDITNIMIVEQLISLKSNINLVVAQTGYEGLEKVQEVKPDMVLLDINLPDIDGFEVAKQIKAKPENKYLPIVALSANAMTMDIERSKENGFDDYLIKPIDFAVFDAALNNYLLNADQDGAC